MNIFNCTVKCFYEKNVLVYACGHVDYHILLKYVFLT